MSTASNTLGRSPIVNSIQFETLHRGLVGQAIFPFDQKLEERVATLIQRKPALPALRKLSPRNLKAWPNPEFCAVASCTKLKPLRLDKHRIANKLIKNLV